MLPVAVVVDVIFDAMPKCKREIGLIMTWTQGKIIHACCVVIGVAGCRGRQNIYGHKEKNHDALRHSYTAA